MPTQWRDRYTPLSNINNGYEFENGDDILAEHINAAIENAAYAKKVADNAYAQTLQKISGEYDYDPSNQTSVTRLSNLIWNHPDIRIWLNYGTLSNWNRAEVLVNQYLTGQGTVNFFYLDGNGNIVKITSRTTLEYVYYEVPASS